MQPAFGACSFFQTPYVRPKSMKNKFTESEDQKLIALVKKFGAKDWINISALMETRNPRQCRERWKNYLNPELRKDEWTKEEDELLLEKHNEFGGKWNKIAKFFSNRSDNGLRNRWMLLARRKQKTESVVKKSKDENVNSTNDEKQKVIVGQGHHDVMQNITLDEPIFNGDNFALGIWDDFSF